MKVRRGWATDFGKIRFDVEIEEVDLVALLVMHGCTDPEGVRRRMDPYDAARIMDCEAQFYVAYSLSKQEPGNAKMHEAAAAAHKVARDKILTRILHPGKDAAAGG
jgi:hypothetical protein